MNRCMITQYEKALGRFKAELVGGLVNKVRTKTMLRLLDSNKRFIRSAFEQGIKGCDVANELYSMHVAEMDRRENEMRVA